jgi:hypothetical protein
MFKVKVEYGGSLVVSYNGLDEQGEQYCHPYYGDDYVWSCENHEINELFHCDDEMFFYPADNEVLELLDSAGVLSDLGLSHCNMGVLAL